MAHSQKEVRNSMYKQGDQPYLQGKGSNNKILRSNTQGSVKTYSRIKGGSVKNQKTNRTLRCEGT